ncbi:hypothetical protein OsJ_34302 [Oryza sativa Japonica Group]|uniref:Prefoldin subunit 2 n=1 Tax=Oryza sativa subsp. japonica TaxID=39947 RepID=B9GB96_ORYSJ|nr:hypothetical protein OsJ_34302 [Oryza sativa Japonica Group]
MVMRQRLLGKDERRHLRHDEQQLLDDGECQYLGEDERQLVVMDADIDEGDLIAIGFSLVGILLLRKMASKAGGDGKEAINEQIIANTYGNMRSEMTQLYTKITELEMEVSEHSLVIGAIEPLDHSRRCYRMVGGVLVERTIREVLPAVHRNKEGLEEVIARMHEALEKKKKEITEFELKYKIRIRKADSNADEEEGSKKEGSAQGVLVGPAGQ